jgi:glutamine synthetase
MKIALSLCLLASATAFAPSVRTAASLRSATTSLSAGVLNRVTGQSQLDPAVIQRYMDLPMPADTVLAEYVWVDADGACRSKTRTLPAKKVCTQ